MWPISNRESPESRAFAGGQSAAGSGVNFASSDTRSNFDLGHITVTTAPA
jgi:hypothetical protein